MRNQDVIQAWSRGERAHTPNLSTDGIDLFSYALRIGTTDTDGGKVVANYRAGGEFYSMTTSHHVSAALCTGAREFSPATFRQYYGNN